MKMRSYYLGELTWVDVEEFLKKHQTAIVPVGSCEQHGPHLPLDTDAYDAFWLSMKLLKRLSAPWWHHQYIMVSLRITWTFPEQ
jgi:creatinine amidohydrolase/Fe(II)-dependent formamide hydrolase-like protein